MKLVFALLLVLVSSGISASTIESEQIVFLNEQTKLAGTIVFPKNTDVKAAVIFVHGSGKQPRFLKLAERFANNGIAMLVYDKRGVGESEGKFESKQPVSENNLVLLASDATAALNTLANHPRLKDVPLGITGLSQAGWIVPIAALESTLTDFIVLWSGPVTKVSEEDILSKYTKDQDSDRVPSFAEALAARKTPYVWPEFLGKDTNPSDSLAQLNIPGLWVFGEKDGSIPVDLSMTNIKALSEQGHSYEYVLFSNAGHMNIGTSISLVVDWIERLSE